MDFRWWGTNWKDCMATALFVTCLGQSESNFCAQKPADKHAGMWQSVVPIGIFSARTAITEKFSKGRERFGVKLSVRPRNGKGKSQQISSKGVTKNKRHSLRSCETHTCCSSLCCVLVFQGRIRLSFSSSVLQELPIHYNLLLNSLPQKSSASTLIFTSVYWKVKVRMEFAPTKFQ